MSNVFLALALLSVAWGIVSAGAITSFMSSRGVRINFLFIRILIVKYVHQYHELTLKERGRPGPWFYSYIVSMNLALVFAIVGLVLRRG
jgi:hypothetical protein